MEKLREIAQGQLNKVPENIREMYEIKMTEDWIEIGSPVYVNIDFDEMLYIEELDVCFRIMNKKAVMTIWKDHKFMQVTIL